jgi:hypothetical protein
MNTYIDDIELTNVILALGWTICKGIWTNCPQHIYDTLTIYTDTEQ